MNNPQAEFQQALALHQRGQLDAAEKIYKSILLSRPKYFDAIFALGIVHLQRDDFRAADRQFSIAIRIDPDNSPLHNNHGNALLGLGRLHDALAAYDKSTAINPQNWEAHYNRGNVLAALKRFEEALASYDRSIALFPDNAQVHDNRGSTLANLYRFDEALASFDRAIRLNPNQARAYANRASTRAKAKQYDKALEDYDRAFALDPGLDYLAGNRFTVGMYACRWDGYEKDCTALVEGVRSGSHKVEPFSLLPIPSSARDQLKCARQFVRDKIPAGPKMPWHGRRYAHDKIRVGYVSSDFHSHPTSHLIAGMLEAHDRERFSIHGFSTGLAAENDEYRIRVRKAFDVFVDACTMSSNTLIDRIRTDEIDILIDLNGLTTGRRTDVFAARPAPVQVNFLGYPGTMGAEYIDYIVADRHLIPEADRESYAEKIAYLPHSYQPNDSKRAVSANPGTREEHGLPETGFVFCCFNNTFKITPDIFDVWTRLLKAVEGSVLWIFCENEHAAANLKAEAERRDVSANRLVFAPRLPADRHRARYALADLFLDTLYYDAHTTASDALWAGLPVVTFPGGTFASRVAASLLHARGMPELIAASLEDYERLALALATNPGMLRAAKTRLAENRDACPLFDTARYTRNLEAAFARMQEISRKGKPPQTFAIED